MLPANDECVAADDERLVTIHDILHDKVVGGRKTSGVIILRNERRNEKSKENWHIQQMKADIHGPLVSNLRSASGGGIGAPYTNGLNRVLDHVALAVGGSHGSIPQHLDVADRKDAIMAKAEGWTDDEQAELRAAIDSQKDNLKAVMKKLQEEVARRLGRGDEQALATPNIRVINLHSSKFGANDFAHAMGAVVETE